jgi:hypothetical protein
MADRMEPHPREKTKDPKPVVPVPPPLGDPLEPVVDGPEPSLPDIEDDQGPTEATTT